VKKERVPHLEQHLQWRRRRPPRGAWTPIADVAVSLETPPGRRSEPVCTLSRGRSPRRFTSPPAATPRRAWSTVNWAELWPTRVSACLPPRHFCCSNRLSLSARALRRRGQNRQNAATCTSSSSSSPFPLSARSSGGRSLARSPAPQTLASRCAAGARIAVTRRSRVARARNRRPPSAPASHKKRRQPILRGARDEGFGGAFPEAPDLRAGGGTLRLVLLSPPLFA
jgi:hypothetical protein